MGLGPYSSEINILAGVLLRKTKKREKKSYSTLQQCHLVHLAQLPFRQGKNYINNLPLMYFLLCYIILTPFCSTDRTVIYTQWSDSNANWALSLMYNLEIATCEACIFSSICQTIDPSCTVSGRTPGVTYPLFFFC